MARENMALRLYARERGVPLWRVARELGISEPTLFRWLREPLEASLCVEIQNIVDKLAEKAG